MAAALNAGSRVLEIAPGPGLLAIALAKLTGGRVTGFDISRSFVQIASDNARKAGVEVDFEQGDAADLPVLDDNSISSPAGLRSRTLRGRWWHLMKCTACSNRVAPR